MNKTVKVILIIAAVMIMTGLALCVAAIASGNWHPIRCGNNIPLTAEDAQTEASGYQSQEYQIDADGISRLEISAVADNIIIKAHADSNNIIVHYTNSKYHRYDIKATGGNLSIRYRDLDHGLGFFALRQCLLPTQMELWLPQSFFERGELDLELVSGKIELQGISGASCAVKSVSGDIQLLDCAFDELDWYSVSGDTLIRGGSGSAHGEAISGSATIEGAGFSKLEINLVSGDIEAELLGSSQDYRIDTKSVSGDVEADRGNDLAAGHIDLQTISGDIELVFHSR
ncbi:MAG: DUF4097 domain-containing protein [Clostridia bacterium]|nr:DUF4097 domain-containing protein [Clostridia bacterium]